MRIQIQARTFSVCLVVLLIQFISCKKENTPNPADKEDVDSLATAKENLVAWYKFTNGNTADFSDKNNHLTAYNVTPAIDSKGRPNNAFAFDGFSSYMEAANSPSLNPSKITLAALFKPTGYYLDRGSTSRILMKEQMINQMVFIF